MGVRVSSSPAVTAVAAAPAVACNRAAAASREACNRSAAASVIGRRQPSLTNEWAA